MHPYIDITPISILKDNYVWAIINKKDSTVVVVDPGEAKPVISFLQQNNFKLVGILITHHHWDHTNGVAELKQHYKVPVYGPVHEKIDEVTHPMREGDEIDLLDCQFKILEIPGHTLGHIAYHLSDHLFCGDTLFAAGCGRIFEGTPEQMYASLNKIAALPDNTKIYCAHEYTLNNLRFAEQVEPHNFLIKKRIVSVTALRQKNIPSIPSLLLEEKETNPFLRSDQPDIARAIEKYCGRECLEPNKIFEFLRHWKDHFPAS
jgi:hydroxyacylglutathione hydrolase